MAESHSWTHGRSSCDFVSRQLLDQAAPNSESRKALEEAWRYSLQDVETLAALECVPEGARAAQEIVGSLRALEGEVMPALPGVACESANSALPQRMELAKFVAARLRAGEGQLEGAWDRLQGAERAVAASLPESGVAFDDCRARAQRGWARARASLNKLSCAARSALERLEAFQEHVAQGNGASLECVPQQVAQGAGNAAPVLLTAPHSTEPSGYQPVTGLEPAVK